jgi:hypothetical protein
VGTTEDTEGEESTEGRRRGGGIRRVWPGEGGCCRRGGSLVLCLFFGVLSVFYGFLSVGSVVFWALWFSPRS